MIIKKKKNCSLTKQDSKRSKVNRKAKHPKMFQMKMFFLSNYLYRIETGPLKVGN